MLQKRRTLNIELVNNEQTYLLATYLKSTKSHPAQLDCGRDPLQQYKSATLVLVQYRGGIVESWLP